MPKPVAELVHQQMIQLRQLAPPPTSDTNVLEIKGDQYRAYTIITNALQGMKNRGVHFFITGGGGTGKSFLLQNLEHFFKRSHINYLKMAPTGIAAINIGGQTIHSALHITSGNIGGDGNLKTSIFVSADRQDELRKTNLLIIDEVSMVNAQLFTFISTIFSRLHDDTRPFGNLHVICCGDLMQLPPVNGQRVFQAPLWLLFQPLFLRESKRQAGDQHFFQLLNGIRFGRLDEQMKHVLEEKAAEFDIRSETYLTTFLVSHRRTADRLNMVMLDSLATCDHNWHIAIDREDGKLLSGTSHLRMFKRGTNFPQQVDCVVGAKVMFLNNTMLAAGISNGSCGVVVALYGQGLPKVAFAVQEGIRVSIPYLIGM